ncbi:MAG: hypothetical protein UZ03_NOB001002740 [Nitrospira sp. OLB3]|nr:MAG: hypothetical protein UZ03_NOB001002740 [Nitrospira sp. OLB3]
MCQSAAIHGHVQDGTCQSHDTEARMFDAADTPIASLMAVQSSSALAYYGVPFAFRFATIARRVHQPTR